MQAWGRIFFPWRKAPPKPEADQVTSHTVSRAPPSPPPNNPAKSGEDEYIKNTFKEIKESEQRLNVLYDQSGEVLLKIKSVFPFDFFPDDVIIDMNKVTIINREFIQTEAVHSVMVRNIASVLVEHDLFFATMKITDTVFKENLIQVRWLVRSEAEKARRIIQGLMLCSNEKVDFTKVGSTQNLAEKIEEMGKIHASSHPLG